MPMDIENNVKRMYLDDDVVSTSKEELNPKQKEVLQLFEDKQKRILLVKKCKASTWDDILHIFGKRENEAEENDTGVETTEPVKDQDQIDMKMYQDTMLLLDDVADNMSQCVGKVVRLKELAVQLNDVEQATQLFSNAIKTGIAKNKEARICFLLSGKIATYIEDQQKTNKVKWNGLGKEAFCKEKLGVSLTQFKLMVEVWNIYNGMPDIFLYSSYGIKDLVKQKSTLKSFFTNIDNSKTGKFAGTQIKEHWKSAKWLKSWTEVEEKLK